jgi:hypothetical protein
MYFCERIVIDVCFLFQLLQNILHTFLSVKHIWKMGTV